MTGISQRTRRWMLTLAMLGWGLLVVMTFGFITLSGVGGDSFCMHETGDSNFGTSSWSWFPLGNECTWTQEGNGIEDHTDPGWGPTLMVGGLLGSGIALARIDRRSGRSSRVQTPLDASGSP